MIISQTPYRMSFFGGGTDYPQWYLKEGGSVLSTTIDKYCFISCRYLPPFFNIRHRIVWSYIETVSSVEEIIHPAVREGIRFLEFEETQGLEIHHQGDLPARSGMGSSSAFSVGLIKALRTLQGKPIEKHELALKAIELEQEIIREIVGSQDQVAVAYGGLNTIQFTTSGEIEVTPLDLPEEHRQALEQSLVLFYTGTSRISSEIADGVVSQLQNKSQLLEEMRAMVDEAASLLRKGEIEAFGQLLHQTWVRKRKLSPEVSNANVDALYERAIRSGAFGGKLLGAGHSGFMVFCVPPERRALVIEELKDILHVPFHFESEGSRIIYQED